MNRSDLTCYLRYVTVASYSTLMSGVPNHHVLNVEYGFRNVVKGRRRLPRMYLLEINPKGVRILVCVRWVYACMTQGGAPYGHH
jgi:hypothetical protein